MTVIPFNAVATVQIETLEGVRLGVSQVQHPTSGVRCLSFTGPEGRRVALVSRQLVSEVRQRVWQVCVSNGTSYTVGPVDMARLRRFAA